MRQGPFRRFLRSAFTPLRVEFWREDVGHGVYVACSCDERTIETLSPKWYAEALPLLAALPVSA